MPPYRYTLLLLVIILATSACESSRPFYQKENRDWPDSRLPGPDNLSHVVFLIGDAGEASLSPREPTFQLLKDQLSAAGENSSVVFLGDNIYPAGLPPEGASDRAQAEQWLNAQLDLLKDFQGQPFFIPGNHDWNRMSAGGREAVQRQAAYIEAYLGRKKVFYPKDGCGDPKAIELNDNLTLILVDSQWWLHPWDEEPEMNTGCDVNSRVDFEAELAELVDDYSKTNILMCMHHPMYTQGSHGGFFPIKEHLFPFTYLSDNLYIPLPVLGSLHPTLRYLGITRQDLTNEHYAHLKEAIQRATKEADNVVFASGHEHALEYFSRNDRHYVVSGAGCKGSYIKRGYDAGFAYDREGFAKLYYYQDGSVWLEFWAPAGQGNEGRVLFRRMLKAADLEAPKRPGQTFSEEWAGMPDTVGYIAAPNYEASRSKRFWLGRNYRNAWTAIVDLPVLNLDTVMGGLRPIQRGGGLQSKSLRLLAANGKEYVLRSIYKDASLILPDFARHTVIDTIFQDQMSMDHPYGAVIIPPLAEAAGVYHSNPRFYYMPRQPRLGDFNGVFGDEAYLFEERPSDDREDVPGFGRSKDIVSYRRMLKKTTEESDHLIDQKQALRSRLFDMLIGDWDRHDDQWRWATFKEDGKTIYQPIPRDRDHAFLSFRGFFPWIASRKWAARQLQSFDHGLPDLPGLNFNARFFDRQYLNDQDLRDWVQMAEQMKGDLSDEAIESAVRRWPDTLFALNGAEIISKLKARRDKLPEFARQYYRFLAKTVDVAATDKRDRFVVTRLPEGKTQVLVYNLSKKGEQRELRYDRTFDRRETREVRLYGLKEDDEFLISGVSGPNVLLRIIGGPGDDLIRDESRVSGGKRTRVYDLKTENNQLELGREAKDFTTTDPNDNQYDRLGFKYPKTLPLILPGVNPDDGFQLNLGFIHTVQGFRKEPFQSRHSVQGQYAFATQAVGVRYTGDFIGVVGDWDLELRALALAPTFVSNYFGLGNATLYPNTSDDNFDFNRLRYGQISLKPALLKRFAMNDQFIRAGLYYTLTDVQRNEGRITDRANDGLSGLTDAAFAPKHYAGLNIGYHIDRVDNRFNPTRGLRLNLESSWNINVETGAKSYFNLNTNLAFYYTPFAPFPLTLAFRGGYAANFGNYEFFQANYLGRRGALRGFRGERFGGDKILFANAEARLKLFKLRGLVLPMNVGLIGFLDTGRVWHDADKESPDADQWHRGWGGGVFLSPYEQIVVSGVLARSKESQFLEVKLGFFF